MSSATPPVVEQDCYDLPQWEVVELSTSELSQVGAGICDPGIFEVEK